MKQTIDVRQIRETKGLTQAAFSEQIGVTRAMVGRYERGEAKPRKNVIRKIENVEKSDRIEILDAKTDQEISIRLSTSEREIEYKLIVLFRLLPEYHRNKIVKQVAEWVRDCKGSILNQALTNN